MRVTTTIELAAQLDDDEDLTGLPAMLRQRPRHRSECVGGFRPCPWATCRHHLGTDVMPNGDLKEPTGDAWLDGDAPSCSLDLADQGAQRREDIGLAIGVGVCRVGQLEDVAFERLYLVDSLREEA